MFHWFHVSWCLKRCIELKRKTHSNCKSECQHVGHHVHLQKLQSRQRKDPRWSHYQSTLSNNFHQSQRQRTTKEPRRKRTGNRHGNTEKRPANQLTDNRSKQSPHPSIRNKRMVLSETVRRYKDLQLRANWIPGGHLRFHVPNSSAKCRSFTSEKQKFLSKMP